MEHLSSLTSPAEDSLLAREVQVNLLAKRCQLAGHPEYLQMVLRAVDLEELESFMNHRFNLSHDAPYHGFTHEAAVVVAAYEACVALDLTMEETRNVIVAEALHDFNHHGVSLRDVPVTDAQNITRAVEGLYLLIYYQDRNFKNRGIVLDINRIERIICSTEYPYTREPADVFEAIVRDADITMPMLNDELALRLFQGLYIELLANKVEISYEEFAAKVGEFYNEIKPNTSWAAEQRAEGKFADRVNRVVTLLKENPL